MLIEQKIVKGSKKISKRVNQSDVVKCSKYVTLGVNSLFKLGKEVTILYTDDYNTLLDNTTDDNTINELNNIITDKDNEIKELNNKIKELTASNDRLNNEVLGLKDDLTSNNDKINELTNKLAKYDAYDIDSLLNKSDELDDFYKLSVGLQSEKIEFKDVINYHVRCNDKLKNRGLIQRLFNKDVSDDIDEPTLKLIDLNGHNLHNSDDKTDDIINKYLLNSE